MMRLAFDRMSQRNRSPIEVELAAASPSEEGVREMMPVPVADRCKAFDKVYCF